MDNLKIQDLLVQDGFTEWVKKPTNESDAFWKQWLLQNPEHQEAADELRNLILMVKSNDGLTTQEENEIWNNIQSEIEAKEEDKKQTKWLGFKFIIGYKQAVAAAVVLIAISLWVLLQPTKKEFSTAFGETKIVVLPDGSKVILNSNSGLTYYTNAWKKGTDRQVFLKGEAFFEVNEQGVERKDRFIVHTDGVDVEVLGTKFNVNSHRSKTKVVLQSGKVRLRVQDDKSEAVFMKPGDMVNFDKTAKTFQIEKVNTRVYASWKDDKLVFDNTSLKEVATVLEDTYGLKVIITDSTLANRRVKGEIDVKEKATLLKALETLYDLQIKEIPGENKIIIDEK